MRVLRIEVDDPKLTGTQRVRHHIRENRYGAFDRDCVVGSLCHRIRSPMEDFDYNPFGDPEGHNYFFAFTPETFFKAIPYIRPYVIVAEYEVEPRFVSNQQVVFHKDTARFISEIRICDLLS